MKEALFCAGCGALAVIVVLILLAVTGPGDNDCAVRHTHDCLWSGR